MLKHTAWVHFVRTLWCEPLLIWWNMQTLEIWNNVQSYSLLRPKRAPKLSPSFLCPWNLFLRFIDIHWLLFNLLTTRIPLVPRTFCRRSSEKLLMMAMLRRRLAPKFRKLRKRFLQVAGWPRMKPWNLASEQRLERWWVNHGRSRIPKHILSFKGDYRVVCCPFHVEWL